MLKVVMARGRRLKKGGDLEVQKQNVASLELRLDESSNLCGLKLTIVTVCNSNDEIIPNTYWEFQSKNDGLDSFKIYKH